MKRLLVVILIAGALWSGYWLVAQRGARAGVEAWFAALRADGWQAQYDGFAVRGFPNRIDTHFTAPVLADPGAGLHWEAPWFQLAALSYKPNHLIAVWPPSQRLITPAGAFDIESGDMRASLVMDPAPGLPFLRSNFVARDVGVTGPGGRLALQGLQLAAGRLDGEGDGTLYRLALNADGLAPPAALRGDRPATLDLARIDLTVGFDRRWEMTGLDRPLPQPRRIELTRAEAKWGDLNLKVEGALDIHGDGFAFGDLTITLDRPDKVLELLRRSGVIGQGQLDAAEGWLGPVQSEGPQTLTLGFRGPKLMLGPIVLGPAPLFRLR
ncbi:MAG: DUF2125 domain-containing protein [Paracoccaceae bacterium]